jgi:hypothetical protein
MDNHIEEKEPFIAQSRAEGANLTDVLDALRSLVATWSAEGNFLTGANDHPQDKAVGKTYKECAKELRAIIGG